MKDLTSHSFLFPVLRKRPAQSAREIPAERSAPRAHAAIASGILCNVLVCLSLLAAAASKEAIGKTLAIWFPIMAFVLGGFEHSVANMYYLPAGLFALSDAAFAAKAQALGIDASALTAAHAARNLLFVTLGNVVGGMLCVAALWSAAHRPARD